jgi:hypothetical protein
MLYVKGVNRFAAGETPVFASVHADLHLVGPRDQVSFLIDHLDHGTWRISADTELTQ